jgi:CBS domain-containing protein
MNASDVMVRDVITVRPDDDISAAVKLLVDYDISALPVIDKGRQVVGIISEADLLHRDEFGTKKIRPWWLEAITPISVLAMDYAKSHGRKVAELMSEKVVTASESTSISELATLFERNRIKRVPIVRDGKLVGVVSRSKLIQALASEPAASQHDEQMDRKIKLEVLARLGEQPWTGFGERNIVVANGIVHVWGLAASPEERKALHALVETVPGVQGISDEMIPAY